MIYRFYYSGFFSWLRGGMRNYFYAKFKTQSHRNIWLMTINILPMLMLFLNTTSWADTYTYTGSNFNSIQNFLPPCDHPSCYSYTNSMKVTGQFTVAIPLQANLSNENISSLITSFSFNDGVQTISSSTQNAYSLLISVSTDIAGNIVSAWVLVRNWTSGTPYATSSWSNDIEIGGPVAGGGDVGLVNLQCGANDCTDILADLHAYSIGGSNIPGIWTASGGGGGGGVPICTLTATPAVIHPGGSAMLSTSCNPAATSYIWTGGYCTGAEAASSRCMNSPDSSGPVSPTVTTTYTITGRNANGTGNTASVTVTVVQAGPAPVVEFYNTNLDTYFITAGPTEQAAIDGGSAGPGWIRTGYSFNSGGSTPVCRFYGSVSPGPNSHFYTVDAAECAQLKQLQATTPATEKRWNFENLDFYSTPVQTYGCPPGTTPVYRAYNNGAARGIDSNHRITTSLAAIQEVVNRGWTDEGMVMCAP